MNEPTAAANVDPSQQRVGPRDIRAILVQAAGELASAALGRELECSKGSLTLPHGVEIHWHPEKRIINPDSIIDHGLMAGFQLVDEGKGRTRMIQAQATAVEPPAVWHRDQMKSWNPGDGSQREWILRNLRKEIEDYMPEAD